MKKIKLFIKYIKLGRRYSKLLKARKAILDEITFGQYKIEHNNKLLKLDTELKEHTTLIDKELREYSKVLFGE